MALCCMNSRWQQYYNYFSVLWKSLPNYSLNHCLKCSFILNRVLINTANIYFNIVTNVFIYFYQDRGHLWYWSGEHWQARWSFPLSFFFSFLFFWTCPNFFESLRTSSLSQSKDHSHFPSVVASFNTFLLKSLLHAQIHTHTHTHTHSTFSQLLESQLLAITSYHISCSKAFQKCIKVFVHWIGDNLWI